MAPGLDRRLGPFDAAAIVVSNVIGGGIFFVPILVAQLVGDARAMLAVWLAGGAFAFMGARSWPRCGRNPVASMSTCARRTDRLPRS